jgi:hypothetical protein
LNPENGLLLGETGGFIDSNGSVQQGDGQFIGNMMGDNGTNAGILYRAGVEAGAIASGVVIFEAQQ